MAERKADTRRVRMFAAGDVPPLAVGHYDLVNISLIEFDPITGRTFKQCVDEHNAWCAAVDSEFAHLRWWQVRKWLLLRRDIYRLAVRQGMCGVSLESADG